MLTVKKLIQCCDHKKGMLPEDFEDAFTPWGSLRVGDRIRIAIADGATESSFSKEWAQALISRFGDQGFDLLKQETLFELATTWEENLNKPNLTWYNEEKFTLGSHASFLGLEIDLQTGVYSAKAVGDCCTMLVRGGRILNSFPVERAEDFSNHPLLVGTKNGIPAGEIRELSGNLTEGDLLILASDAFAGWILAQQETQPWNNFLGEPQGISESKNNVLFKNFESVNKIHEKKFPDHKNYFLKLALGDKYSRDEARMWTYQNWLFHNLVVRERAAGSLKNDDATLCLVQF